MLIRLDIIKDLSVLFNGKEADICPKNNNIKVFTQNVKSFDRCIHISIVINLLIGMATYV